MLVVVVVAGCSGLRRIPSGTGTIMDRTEGGIDSKLLYDNNIAAKGVYISKMHAEFISGNVSERFNANLRVSGNGQWLLSIRTVAGIEAARIHADRESVTVLDRLSRRAIIYPWAQLKNEYRLSYEILPLILGDLPAVFLEQGGYFDCISGKSGLYGQDSVKITVDCVENKISDIFIDERNGRKTVSFEFSAFTRNIETVYPSKIVMTELSGMTKIAVEYEELVSPWNGSVSFEIPRNYQIVK